MRALQHAKTEKLCNHKKNKNKRVKKTLVSNYRNDVGKENLENINEVFRLRKISGGSNSWKLIPKDSCEVYKARRRRQINDKRLQERERSKSEDSSCCTRESRVPRRKPTNNKKKITKKTKNQRQRRRCRSNTSVSSYTSCDSTSFDTSMSVSDMDYE